MTMHIIVRNDKQDQSSLSHCFRETVKCSKVSKYFTLSTEAAHPDYTPNLMHIFQKSQPKPNLHFGFILHSIHY